MRRKDIITCGCFLVVAFGLSMFVPIGTTHPSIRSQPLRNKAFMKGLEIAINGYYAEYGNLPPAFSSLAHETKYVRSDGTLIRSISGERTEDNPKQVMFYNPPIRSEGPRALSNQSEVKVVDSWGEAYHLAADTNNDGKVSNPEPGAEPPQIPAKVIIYSSGPDKNPNTWKDNIKSWD